MKREFAHIVYTLYNRCTMNKEKEQRSSNQMKPRQIKFPEELWKTAQVKAGTIPVSVVIRRLVERWVKGEISLD